MDDSFSYDFAIKIDFEHDRIRPSHIFFTMSQLIETFYLIDKHLLEAYNLGIEHSFILKDVEVGSIKAMIITLLNTIDDDALKSLDWKKIVGSYLVKGKKYLLQYLEDKNAISTIDQIKEIEQGLVNLAENEQVPISPFPLPMHNILKDLNSLVKATHRLTINEEVSFIYDNGEVQLNKNFSISTETIEELLTQRTISYESDVVLYIKKPDYLGKSMWNVYIDNKSHFVKFLDYDWLDRFQSRHIDVKPGDALRSHVKTTVKYAADNTEISVIYDVLKVYEVISSNYKQMNIEDFLV
jgi:hypothetical protein